ncbi:MAG: PQQ-binding-like beta-propeller repeat protein, partial [Rubripirellula sp.]|nr:PQQ-binding-like beta-propeller repeat protein [Rubripirellula sp.]
MGHLVRCSLLGLLVLFGDAHQLSADELEASDNAAPWSLPRGNSQSSGYTPSEVASSPSILWEVKLDEAIETTPVVGFGKVFTADVFGKIYALDQKTGEVKWKRDFETGFLASPSLNDRKV